MVPTFRKSRSPGFEKNAVRLKKIKYCLLEQAVPRLLLLNLGVVRELEKQTVPLFGFALLEGIIEA